MRDTDRAAKDAAKLESRSYQEIAHFANELSHYITDLEFAAEYEARAQVATDGNVSGLEAIVHCLMNRLEYAGLVPHSATPELLAACKEAHKYFVNMPGNLENGLREMLGSAIAKAEAR